MKLCGLVPMLETEDLKKSIEFYSDVLGFVCEGTYPDHGEICWASLRKDEVVLMLTVRSEHSKLRRPTMTGTLYFYPDDIDEAWRELSRKKVKTAYDIETFDYGMREFGVYDRDGYLLQFGQDIEEVTPDG